MKDIAIYGAGGLGREMALIVEQINAEKQLWNLVGFYDDGKRDEVVDGVRVLGGMDELNRVGQPLSVIIAIGDCHVRSAVAGKINNLNVDFPVIIHPGSNRGSLRNVFGRGSIITAGCVLTTGVSLGEFVIVNLSCTIGHDVTLGSFTSVMPGSNISGSVTIGEKTLIGTGVQILQGIEIGTACRIGAGAVVTKSVQDEKTVVGIPAREKQ
jgi:sugar O-acyltransferase (sialic acid O-acetyltransferase NeuD family)